MSSLRDHGYGLAPKVLGAPVARFITDPVVLVQIKNDHGCPNCHCEQIMEIEVAVEPPFFLLPGDSAIGKYLGCPACPWASPMVIARK